MSLPIYVFLEPRRFTTDLTSHLVGHLHQRHLKPTQCPTIRVINRKIDTIVRTTPTIPPYCHEPAHRLRRGSMRALGVVTQAVALRVGRVR
jgi:hypothetical protein